jgi:predicted membrane protein
VALVALGLTEMPSRFSFFHFGCIFFGAYFALDNWNVLPFSLGKSMIFPAILVLFGLSLLVHALRKPKKRKFHVSHSSDPKQMLTYRQEGFDYTGSFGEDTSCVYLEKLSSGTISTNFGDFTVDLSGVKKVSKNCRLEVSCSFGQMTLLVPSRFEVQMEKSCVFAENSISGHPDPNPEGIIHLDASVSFGEFQVKYI